MNIRIPYGRQHITQEDIDCVVTSLHSDFLTQGPLVSEFETKFAEYIGCKYAVAVSNGTAALHLSAMALNVNSKSNVITTPITFSASANCIRYCGGNVYFADIDPQSFLLDVDKVEALIRSKPKGFFHGIIPVDFAGAAVNLEQFKVLAEKYNLWILEDACHAPGGYFVDRTGKKQHCGNGNFADLAIFSFHPVKHIACGEGGMITTNNEAFYLRLKKLRTHGITNDPALMQENHGGWYMELQELGYNYRLPDILCALGISQLSRADEGLARRIQIADLYDKALAEVPHVTTPHYHKGHSFHLYVILHEKRKALYDYLRTKDIYAQVHYIPVHLMPYYRDLGWKKGDFPHAEQYYDHCLSIPMYPTLTDEQQEYVINTIKSFEQS